MLSTLRHGPLNAPSSAVSYMSDHMPDNRSSVLDHTCVGQQAINVLQWLPSSVCLFWNSMSREQPGPSKVVLGTRLHQHLGQLLVSP